MMILDSLEETKKLEAEYIKFYNLISSLDISEEDKNCLCKIFVESNASKEWLRFRDSVTNYRNKCQAKAEAIGDKIFID